MNLKFSLPAAEYKARPHSQKERTAPVLGLEGPYELNPIIIDLAIKEVLPGNYALGNMTREGDFIVRYVGRTDRNLRKQLRFWASRNPGYKSFMASYAVSPEIAYAVECKNFHDFGGCGNLDNAFHPRPPEDMDVPCPICGIRKRQGSRE